jgi:hypothetical protein
MEIEAVTNILPKVTMTGVSGFLFNVIMGLLGIGVVAFMIWFIWRDLQYKYKVTVLKELSNGGTLIDHDRGRIKRRKDGTEIFLLKKYRTAKLSPPPLDSFEPNTKGKMEVFIKNFGNGNFDYYPIGISLRGLQVYTTPFLTSRNNWISTEIKRSQAKHGSFWEKYGAMVVMGGLVVFTGIVLIVVFKMNSQSAEMLGTGMETLANSIETFKTSAITQQTAPLI